MADSGIPDSVSGDHLRSLLGQTLARELPYTDVLPSLDFGGGTGADGGICDLQFVLMQVINQSSSGISLMQEFTCALYLLHSIGDSLSRQTERVVTDSTEFGRVDPRDKTHIINSLAQIQLAHEAMIDIAEKLHFTLVANACHERAEKLRESLGPDSTEDDLRSHLLLSDELLAGLDVTRQQADLFVIRSAES